MSEKVNNPDKKYEALPTYFADLSSIVANCHQNKGKLLEIKADSDFSILLDGRSKKYIAGKRSILKKFFQILSKHEVFRHFCQLGPDPEFMGKEIPLIFLKLRGPKAEEKNIC